MTDKYIKTDGKVYVSQEINIAQKLLALQDTKKQLEDSLAECIAEIAELNSKK